MNTKPTAADLLQTLGYVLDRDILAKEYEAAGIAASNNLVRLHEISSPFIIEAYRAGQNGRPLKTVAPWLKEI